MARGADLTKTLDSAEVARLRAMLADNPVIEPSPGSVRQYPRMLFHRDYLKAQQDWRLEPAELIKKTHAERMKVCTHTVDDPDEEGEFLADGWKRSPADFLDPKDDPRIPVGREKRKAEAQQGLSRDERIRELRLQLAELTGQIEPEPAREEPPAAKTPQRRGRWKTRRRRSQLVAKRVAVGDATADETTEADQE